MPDTARQESGSVQDCMAQRTFMTPAQQREYLNELRKSNAEIYNLTGRPLVTGRDPWANPSPNPKVDQSILAAEAAVEQRPLRGPPKPPKSSNLRDASKAMQAPKDAKTIELGQVRAQPRALPIVPKKPSKISKEALPSIASLQIDSSTEQKANAREEEAGRGASRKVSITLTNYDIPQLSFDTKSAEATKSDESQRLDSLVTLPIFRFDGPESDRADRKATPKQSVPQITIDANQEHDLGSEALAPHSVTSRRRGRRSTVRDDLTRQIKRGLCCANCYEPFGRGRVITANNRRYHPIHFTCYECDIPLEHVDFYTHDPESDTNEASATEHSEIYCHFDYHELFSPKCHVCETPVIRNGIAALGRVYHAEHFFCALCSQTFSRDANGDTEFVERDKLAWHPTCYEEKFSESFICRKCKKKIAAGSEVITMSTGTHFHSECFQCALCRQSLAEGFYWSNKKEGICRSCKEIEVKRDL